MVWLIFVKKNYDSAIKKEKKFWGQIRKKIVKCFRETKIVQNGSFFNF